MKFLESQWHEGDSNPNPYWGKEFESATWGDAIRLHNRHIDNADFDNGTHFTLEADGPDEFGSIRDALTTVAYLDEDGEVIDWYTQ